MSETLNAPVSTHRDSAVFSIIEKEKWRQTKGLELIASENYVSEQVMAAMGSVLTNKYAEGLPGKRYYGGCEHVDEVEELAVARVKQLFGASWANVQPHSGAQANAAVMLACLKPGDTILGFDLSHGGHLTHGSPVNFSGKLYRATFYGVDKATGRIDMDAVAEKARAEKPKLIICGASAYSRDWDYARFRAIADEVGALLLADVSHPAGLIAAKLLNDPLPHCHVVTTTTHKTLRGPRGGLILCRQALAKDIDRALFPGVQGGPLMHIIAAKAVCFRQAATPAFATYQRHVVENARTLAEGLMAEGFRVVSGGTDNHLVLLDVFSKGITGKVAEAALGRAAITVNKNAIPFDTNPPMVASGIRLGTPAMTTRGMGADEARLVASLIARVLAAPEDAGSLAAVKAEVETLCQRFPLYRRPVSSTR